MNISFDYYNNLEDVELFLCNPDEKQLFPLSGINRNLKLRFNDLSELTFDAYPTATDYSGETISLEAYDYIKTKRLVFASKVGWFQIRDANEQDDGTTKHKSVTCESLQSVFKNKGVITEDRTYCFYNQNDPQDSRYDSTNDGDIPSVAGQLYKQLGIATDLRGSHYPPAEDFDVWTITYITPALIFDGATGTCRSFSEGAEVGYDWMVKDVSEAFGVIFNFDFLHKSIQVLAPGEATRPSNIVYSFSNFMKNVNVKEDADNLVTVLTCNGSNVDIRDVNPTGTNYLCDFHYYMDKAGHKWMSNELIEKLEEWEEAVETSKPQYQADILALRAAYMRWSDVDSKLELASLALKDLKAARDDVIRALTNIPSTVLRGIVSAETVESGMNSLLANSRYYSAEFNPSLGAITAYKNQPTWNNGTFTFSGPYITDTPDNCCNHRDGETYSPYLYFSDLTSGSQTSYCKLQSRAVVNKEAPTADYKCKGFKRFIDYSGTNDWVSLQEAFVAQLDESAAEEEASVDELLAQITAITEANNIVNYFRDYPALYDELSHYWIEGDYTNDNISVEENTTHAEEIDLENELMASGAVELAKVSQPHYDFGLSSTYVIGQKEFETQAKALNLGTVIAVEKEDGLWYYPALLAIDVSLDDDNTFELGFANSWRMDDWGYTYADLISAASNTSRQVTANWSNLMDYTNNKAEITGLIKDPLSAALRASFANAKNQEFTVDDTGILGRKFADDTGDVFDPEQVRMLNNMIIFTDDNWEHARAALGKIQYTNAQGQQEVGYGLVADTLIGSLVLAETLSIKNEDSTIDLNSAGIAIKNGNTTVFSADVNGNVSITGSAFGWTMDSNGFTMYSGAGASRYSVMSVDANGATISGWIIQDDEICKGKLVGGVNEYCGMYCGDDTYASLVTPGGTSEIRFYSGWRGGWNNTKFMVLADGSLYASAGSFTGSVNATSGTFNGTVYASDGSFAGALNATSGSFGLIGTKIYNYDYGQQYLYNVTQWSLTNGYIYCRAICNSQSLPAAYAEGYQTRIFPGCICFDQIDRNGNIIDTVRYGVLGYNPIPT